MDLSSIFPNLCLSFTTAYIVPLLETVHLEFIKDKRLKCYKIEFEGISSEMVIGMG